MSQATGRTLVTGAAGFIGGRVALRQAAAGRDVIALDLPGRPADHLQSVTIRLEADITRPDSLDAALKDARIDLVVHCAALMGGWGSPDEYRRVNVDGTRNVLAWAAATGVRRFIYISSVSVYGMPAVTGIDETRPFRHIGLPYGDSKMEAERAVLQHH
ncbi:MAG TPA: NAD(P)-dependent oxidoreductase, partial [Candidatus Polarisedimenticolia bacterium]|nr:NAD(P)-dependent oxidoreductase [Candidatus Polarisedimenticolia bacterium]